MWWIIISILSAIILVCSYIIYNLHRKLVVAETVTSSYKSDDEIGFFFNEIKKLNSLLSDFTLTK